MEQAKSLISSVDFYMMLKFRNNHNSHNSLLKSIFLLLDKLPLKIMPYLSAEWKRVK
jgi:hypothetical protein